MPHRLALFSENEMPLFFQWLVTAFVMTGIFVSWEPGAELSSHSHPHGSGHEFLPPHEITASDFLPMAAPFSTDDAKTSGFHSHFVADFHVETCTDRNLQKIRFFPPRRAFLSGENEKTPDPVFHQVDLPPLI
jgi:hypothetical protein